MSQITSIAICVITYNGSKRIEETLSYISKLEIPINTEVSLVLVDNASTDNTEEIVRRFWKKCNSKISLIFKKMLNNDLAKARQLAYEDLIVDYVITCDDDNLLPPD